MSVSSGYVPSFEERKLQKLGRQQASWQVRAERLHDQKLKNKIDTETLDLQCKTRQLKETLARQEELDYELKQLEINRRLGEMEKEQARQRIERERADLRFSLENIKREQTREWDLNDPEALAKMPKIRVDKVDANGKIIISKELGPSSGQVYDGEDLYANDRVMKQYQQFKIEMERDMQQQAAKRALSIQEQRDYEQKQLQLLEYLKEEEKKQQELRKQKEVQILEENMQMEAERKEKARLEKEEALRLERQHLDNFAHTRIMQEMSRPGIVDEFKGFDKERVEEFNRTVQQQIAERQQKLALEAQEKEDEDAKMLEVNRQLAIREQQQLRERYNLARQLAEENKTMGVQQRTKRFNDRFDLGINQIQPGFHENFGKSNR